MQPPAARSVFSTLPRLAAALALGAAMLAPLAASAVTIDWVTVGNSNNLPDTPSSNCVAANCGSVDHAYLISKYEVTNAQYAEFLNAKAASDPLGLYNPGMSSSAWTGGITQSGISGSYTYTVKAGFASKPVTYISFWDAARFSNWLNNGQGAGDTETGAYTLLGGTANPSNYWAVTRNGGTNIFLTSENEWYKAAYYDPIAGLYYDYPTGTNAVTGCVLPGSDTGNSANCWPATNPNSATTNVGAYGLSDSPYGTYDQGGNVWEWTEQSGNFGTQRVLRGGGLNWGAPEIAASLANWYDPTSEGYATGFRVASIPEPSTGLLVLTGLGGLALRQRRRG